MLRIFKNKITTLSDDTLLQRYKEKGDIVYLGQLFERYSSLIYGVCLKYLKKEVEAEDACMQIFEKLTKKVPQHSIQNFKSWLYTLVKNHCLEILRQQKRHLTVSYESDFMQKEPYVHPFEEDLQEQPLQQLAVCMNQLELEQKECVQLFYYQSKSYKEIAEMKQVPIGKIRSFIQNGRRNLKICMGSMNNEQ